MPLLRVWPVCYTQMLWKAPTDPEPLRPVSWYEYKLPSQLGQGYARPDSSPYQTLHAAHVCFTQQNSPALTDE